VVCGNDVLAFGALLEAQRMGIAVPEQLSIVGFDDLELAAHLEPALTTVRVPSDEMWRLAVERVLAALRGETPPRATQIQVSLVLRESSGPPPAVRQARAAMRAVDEGTPKQTRRPGAHNAPGAAGSDQA
jgi:LacI family transcriptional regulator